MKISISMYLIWGKGKVGRSLAEFFSYFKKEYKLVDDSECFEKGKLNSTCQKLFSISQKIIPSPGIPLKHLIYKNYFSKLIGEVDAVYETLKDHGLLGGFKFIGVTGTDGKSTVTYLIAEGLRRLGIKAMEGGNFDVPFSKIVLDNLDSGGYIVLEVSSFMGYLLKSAKLEVVGRTNFSKDHLDWHIDMKDYFGAKIRIAKRAQKVFASFDLQKVASDLGIDISFLNWEMVLEIKDLENPYLLGKHNKLNLSLAASILQYLGFETTNIKRVLRDIKGLPHRIQFVGTIENKIKVWDDGKSTTPQSLEAGLKAMPGKVVLIAGGYDKGADFGVLKDVFKKKVAFGVFMGQTSHRFAEIFLNLDIPYVIVKNMEEAVSKSVEIAKKRQIENILFSPACASFDMFRNRKERVKMFLEAIKGYLD